MSYPPVGNQQAITRIQPSAFSKPLRLMVLILLIATAFRFLAADSAPPGWRDDELIEYGMDRRIADGWRPLFITEAEGHEPVYHYLHAATILLFGDNLVGYKWLPLACGLISIALTFALARKVFDVRIALLAAALMAVSFWPIMYARFGVRHIGTLPWMLAAFYWLYPSPQPSPQQGEGVRPPRPLRERIRGEGRVLLAGICLAGGLMTYFAGRAVPIVLAGFLGSLLIFQRSLLKRVWWRYMLAIVIGVVIAAPMFIEIAHTPGAEKRTEVVGGPLIELRKGNVQPAIETTLGTLGMFTFAGDPESLYNLPNRPVFDWITGAFFYLGVLVCLIRLKRIESGFALVWLVIGIAPAFVSVPAASFSHTIVALPVVYIFAAIGVVAVLDKMTRWQDDKMNSRQKIILSSLHLVILSGIITLNGWLTIRDYFGTWAHDDFVRFQYHAPTREIAKWLDQNPQTTDVAIGTHVTQLQLDPVAFRLDLKREDVRARWFNPETLYVVPPSGVVVISSMQALGPDITFDFKQATTQNILAQDSEKAFEVYQLDHSRYKSASSAVVFGNAIGLSGWGLFDSPVKAGSEFSGAVVWKIEETPVATVLKSFVHLIDTQARVVAGSDREDLNIASLRSGDFIEQWMHVPVPADLSPGPYRIEVGWYIPETGERLKLPNGDDRYIFDQIEVVAP